MAPPSPAARPAAPPSPWRRGGFVVVSAAAWAVVEAVAWAAEQGDCFFYCFQKNVCRVFLWYSANFVVKTYAE